MISQDTALLLICSCLHKMLEYPYEGISIIRPSESKLYEDHFQMPSTPSSGQATGHTGTAAGVCERYTFG